MSSCGHSQLLLKDVDLEQFLRTGRKEMSQLCSGEVREEFGEMPPCHLHLSPWGMLQ